ncbi:YciI family protein [Euzebya tangerina]|uniref:YciI family protein n=1 Tax=Euzebya tangerina TaxID=591198 RepID=UPI000E31710E|nr:YciI family protein [Euzebya tangerina]
MHYMLLLTGDPSRWDNPPVVEPDNVIDDWVEMTEALADAGVLLGGDALDASDTATTVRRQDADRLLTDGPFAETTEMLIGYYLIDVDDLDAAVAWAERMPNIRYGAVEIRPVRQSPASGNLAL